MRQPQWDKRQEDLGQERHQIKTTRGERWTRVTRARVLEKSLGRLTGPGEKEGDWETGHPDERRKASLESICDERKLAGKVNPDVLGGDPV